jgi:hypothetical protein
MTIQNSSYRLAQPFAAYVFLRASSEKVDVSRKVAKRKPKAQRVEIRV